MAGTRYFDDLTHWDQTRAAPGAPNGGWYRPGENRFIRPDDHCWDVVLNRARRAYGDPNIHYDTDSPRQDRNLVFGDGTSLPRDGMVVYHDAANKRNWAQNDDGTASLVGDDGKLGAPVRPAGYRRIGDHYAPVNDHGQQVAPQLPGVPSSDNGFYSDPKTGVLTPKNLNGDYFTLGPNGKKTFFDKNGHPISEQQFNDAARPREPSSAVLATDEQQSGHAADAVKRLQDELKKQFNTIGDADERLAEVLLDAHATTAGGQKALNDIQKKIVEAANDPSRALDTPAGQRAFLTFLRSQVDQINDVLNHGWVTAEDKRKAADALAAFYAAEQGGTPPPPSEPQKPPQATPPPAADPGVTGPGVVDPALVGPPPAMPDPTLGDMRGGLGPDPMAGLASALPAALSPLGGLNGLAGAGYPLAGLASQLGNQGGHGDSAPGSESAKEAKAEKPDPHETKPDEHDNPKGGQGAGQQDGHNATAPEGDGRPPEPIAAPVAASPVVKLPDGSSATARTPQTAAAIRDYLAGGTVDTSYRQNGIELPPPGTPVTNPVDPSRLACGDLGIFKDHYVPVLSSVKAFVNGQVAPLSSVSSSPDFLGWLDPTTLTAGAQPPAQPAPLPVARPPDPADLTGAATPVPGG
jgi:hypothetical protein